MKQIIAIIFSVAVMVAFNTPFTDTNNSNEKMQTKKDEQMKNSQKIAIARGIEVIRDLGFAEQPVLFRLLSKGNPVSVKELAIESGSTEEKIREVLSRLSGVEYDDQGNILGYGMTLKPTPHRFDFSGKTVYGWCASDAILFPAILGESGIVSSTCPITKQKIKVEITPDTVLAVDPPDAVVTSIRPTETEQIKDVRSEICGLGLFVSSKEAASDWLTAYPEGFLHTVQEDFAVHKQVIKELKW